MAHLRHRRNRVVEGPVSASLFFDSPKPSTSVFQKVPRRKKIFGCFLTLLKLTYHLLLLTTLAFFTLPTLLCTPHLRPLLPGQLDHICVLPGSIFPPELPLLPLFNNTNAVTTTAADLMSQEVKQLRNFAHFGDGARILPEVTSITYGTKDNGWLSQEAAAHGLVSKTPPYVVSDEAMRIGDCWQFSGGRGTLGILLSEPAHIASLRLNNIHPDLVSPLSAAKSPRTLYLWGLVGDEVVIPPGTEVRQAVQFSAKSEFTPKSRLKTNDRFAHLFEVNYNLRVGPTYQTFQLPLPHWSADFKFRAVVLEIRNNWGGNTTCLYHLSIHQERH